MSYSVYDVPFTATVKGTAKVLAKTPQEALEHTKVNLAFDDYNVVEAGVLHDGTLHFHDIDCPTPEIGAPTLSSDDPTEHPDYDLDDHGDELEVEDEDDGDDAEDTDAKRG